MVLKPHITENLYIRYALYNNDKKRKNYYAHTLVASTFLKDYKKDMIINHINCNKSDNNISNLEQVTNSENVLHAYKNGLINKPISKLDIYNSLIHKINILYNNEIIWKDIKYGDILSYQISTTGLIINKLDNKKLKTKNLLVRLYIKDNKIKVFSVNTLLKKTFLDTPKISKPIDEKWLTIKNYPMYQISNYGNIKSSYHNKKNLTGTINKGYLTVGLYHNNIRKRIPIHILVINTFRVCYDVNKIYVNHIDGNKLNNRLDNLEFVTPSENTLHASNNNLIKYRMGENHTHTKLNIDIVKEIFYSNDSIKNIANKFNISISNVYNIKGKRIWKHIVSKL